MRHESKKFSIYYLKAIHTLLGLLCLCMSVEVKAFDETQDSKWSGQVGLDFWQLNPSVSKDSDPGFSEENTNLLLPNAATTWDYKDLSPYVNVIGAKQITNSTSFSLKARANQTVGMRLDEASFQYNLSPTFGARAGIVNYKTSWCRAYEPDNGWMREIEAICVTPQFLDVTGGAPGAQLFANNTWGDYLVQSQIGIYRPLEFNYAPKEYGNLIPSREFEVQKNHKIGFNINVLNLQTAMEARVSYLRANQAGYLPETNVKGQSNQTSDLWYWAVGTPIFKNFNVRLSHLFQAQKSSCTSEIAPIGSACNLDLELIKNSTSIELSYRKDATNLLSMGVSQTKFDMNQDFFSPNRDQHQKAALFFINTRQISVAWRHEWGQGLFSIVQAIQSNQNNGTDGRNYASHGNAIGMRVGYQF